MENFPRKVIFLSDDTEAELIHEILKLKERTATYRYIKAEINLGKEFTLLLSQIEKLLKDKLIKTN